MFISHRRQLQYEVNRRLCGKCFLSAAGLLLAAKADQTIFSKWLCVRYRIPKFWRTCVSSSVPVSWNIMNC